MSTIFALSSGTLPSAIAVFRVSGPQSLPILRQLSRRKVWTPKMMEFTKLYDSQRRIIDESMAVYFPGPKTFTGEDTAEFFLHGSQAVAQKFATCLSEIENVREAKRGEFTRRAFHNGKMSISEVRGLDRLIRSRTEKERRAAFGQMRGGTRAVEIRKKLVEILSKLFVIIDFGEHVALELSDAQKDVAEILAEINRLILAWEGAERAQRGLEIVLYGRPNSGKSSILNQLAHDDVAIVSEIPGTTRDSLVTTIQINGIRCRLTDTAGIRPHTNDVIEAEGIRRAQRRLESADVICFVVDPESRSDDVANILEDVKKLKNPESKVLIVKNKADLKLPYPEVSSSGIHVVSSHATSSEGCQKLRETLGSLVDQLCPETNFLLDAELLRKCSDELTCSMLCQDAAIMCQHIEKGLEHIAELTQGTLLDKSSFLPYPPFEVSFARRTHFYGLQLNCTGNNHRWLPRLVFVSHDPNNVNRKAYLTLQLDQFDVDMCSAVDCHTKCTWTVHGGLRVSAKACCNSEDVVLCRTDAERGRHMLLAFNSMCALVCIGLIPIVCYQRKRQHEARGWALMELFLIGASILYSVLFLDIVAPPEYGCCVAVWLRQIGFSIFYGSIVLKIYRNLQEYRVRKAQHVSVREQDMLKYLAAMLALTITGLMAWTVGSWGDTALWRTAWPQCLMQGWHVIWHGYELLFLLYAVRLCYKARNSDWLERWQFTVAVCLEAVITLMANLIRYSIRNSGRADTLFIVSFVHLQLTVSVNIVIIVAPKFYLSNGEPSRRSMTLGGHSGRAHPSLAKLRDNILNGTIDFAEVPIVDMNPEDIRAELKRVYTQLRMYKLKNLYQDNPHISKKRGGKKWSDKNTKATRRISIPSCSPQAKRIEEDEKSDLTVESSPHNIYLSNFKGANVNNIEQHNSVRV
ncbi:hypothetical protein L3Y34_016687 [Caenorhabditis briggsae]|uniref:G-protein coupled receptors family 3 profile domain-containing protein n=1 Tax=Caenorhabditis briggsae TaxID=6238 RepID=A0AAE9DYW7_CAEBR|nr:hypothetical protein L3Y34_016687 [Caenorhabditis briggsae]